MVNTSPDVDQMIVSRFGSSSSLRSAMVSTVVSIRPATEDRRTGGVQGVFDAILLFLHLGLGGRTDIDDGNAAGQLGQTLLQLLTVVVRRGVLDLLLDLSLMRPWMSAFLPAPSMMVVFSFSMVTCLAVPRSASSTSSSFSPRSSAMNLRRSGWRCLRAWPCGDRRSQGP